MDELNYVSVRKGAPVPYTLTKAEKLTEDHTRYTAYGIDANDARGNAVARISDVSCDARMVKKMIDLFNTCRLPPDRLQHTVSELLP